MISVPDIKKYLNRDGLEEYNSLLPHSGAEMQTYVNAWLDEHPEATTTVQDGAITEPKLADKSVSLRTLADDTVHMLKGAILTGNLSGEVLTTDDAYSAPPVALTVEGKSTQDGTPTPESPVEIVSIEQVNLGFLHRNLFDKASASDYANWDTSRTYAYFPIVVPPSTPIVAHYNHAPFGISNCFLNLKNTGGSSSDANSQLIAGSSANARNTVRVISSTGGRVFLNLYSKSADNLARAMNAIGDILQIEVGDTAHDYVPFVSGDITNVLLNLTQALRSLPDGTHDELSFAYLRQSTREGWAWFTPTLTQNVRYARLTNFSQFATLSNGHHRVRHGTIANAGATHSISNHFVYNSSTYNYGNPGDYYISSGYMYCIVPDELTTLEAVNEWAANNVAVLQFAASPAVTTLDPVELPFTAAPDFTVWNNTNTVLQVEYVRNANIVIQNIEQAIADQ